MSETLRWVTDLRKNSSARPKTKPNLVAHGIECFVNKENDEKISKGLLGMGTQMPTPPQTASPARRCKNTFTKTETGSKEVVPYPYEVGI